MVSVLVVTYNSSNTIIETLESIYAQDYSKIELIVADDGSIDDTVLKVLEWLNINKGRFVNTEVLVGENKGVSCNCNRGISVAKGKYIQVVAGDDVLLPMAISAKREYAKENALKIVFSKIEPFGDSYESVKKMVEFCESGYEIINKGYVAQQNAILKDNFVGGPSCSFFQTEYIRSIGGYDEKYPMLDDYPFIFHFLMNGNEIKLMDDVLIKYRISDGSLCMKKGSPMYLSHAKFFFSERLPILLSRKKYFIAIRQSITFGRIWIIFWAKNILYMCK